MNSKGFSLIELAVSIAIIGIISVIVFTGYRYMGRKTILEDQANSLIANIEDARGVALSATEMKRNDEQVDYFTINFNEDGYTLFKDTEQEKTYYFEDRVEIKEGYNTAIGFTPPEPEITFLDDNLEDEILEDEKCIEIVLNYEVNEEENDVIIRVNRVGLAQLVNEQICN